MDADNDEVASCARPHGAEAMWSGEREVCGASSPVPCALSRGGEWIARGVRRTCGFELVRDPEDERRAKEEDEAEFAETTGSDY